MENGILRTMQIGFLEETNRKKGDGGIFYYLMFQFGQLKVQRS